jgi:hypothetical protein
VTRWSETCFKQRCLLVCLQGWGPWELVQGMLAVQQVMQVTAQVRALMLQSRPCVLGSSLWCQMLLHVQVLGEL